MAKKIKVLLLSMGGTIFSVIDKGTVRVAENTKELVDLVPRIQEAADVTLEIVVNVDSTNVGVTEWLMLLEKIRERYNDYDAFVVAHGTNTMAYTATAVSFGLGPNLTKPVILTGSQLPLTAYGDDARFNLEHSVQAAVIAVEKNVAEVMVCFHDLVLRGCRTVKMSESDFRAFNSPALEPLARINATGIIFADHAMKSSGKNFVPPANPGFSDQVLCIDLVPGLNPHTLETLVKDGQIKGIVIKSHGAGSVPDQGKMSLIPFIKKSTENNLPIVVTTKFLGGNSFRETNDEPAVRALRAGAINSGDMTDVAAQVKLMFLIAQNVNRDEIAKKFSESYVGEVS